MDLVAVAIRMANAHPLFGIGHNAYNTAYNAYDFSKGAYGSGRSVHSSFFGILAELGYEADQIAALRAEKVI